MVVPESETGSALVHEGFGSNQLAVLLTWVTFATKGATVGIEEPEIHLHPRSQGELAKVLAEIAKQEQKQLLLATHSEHILTSLLTQVAAGTIKPEELAIYSFFRDKRTGGASAERLPVTDKGAVKGGLKDFFEVEWAEVREYVDALSKRPR